MDSKQDSVTRRVISIDSLDLERIIKNLETFSAQSWAFASHITKTVTTIFIKSRIACYA